MGERIGWLMVVLVVFTSVATCIIQSPAVYSDPGWGILASEQYLRGKSPNILSITQASQSDLARDRTTRVSWYAPSYQAVPFLFRLVGLSWGSAVRATVMLAWAVGMAGWGRYLRMVSSGVHDSWLVCLFLLFHYSNSNFYIYDGGELLLWGVFPHILLLNVWALRCGLKVAAPGAFAAGAGSALTFIVKYSALLPVVGIAVAWLYLTVTARVTWTRSTSWFAGLAIAGVCLLAAGFPGGPTPTGGTGWQVSPSVLLPLVNWILAMTDLDSFLRWLFLFPGKRVLGDARGLGWIALVLTGALFAVFVTSKKAGPAPGDVRCIEGRVGSARDVASLAMAVAITTPIILGVLYARSAPIDLQARHLRVPALLVLPFVWRMLWEAVNESGRTRRGLACVLLVTLFLLPGVYGAGALVDKGWFRAGRGSSLVGPQGLRLDVLGPGASAKAVYEEMKKLNRDGDVLLYLTSPDLGVSVADKRLLLSHADFETPEELGAVQYHGKPPAGVMLLLPARFEVNDKARMIRESFLDIRFWRRVQLEAAPSWNVYLGL